MKSTSKSSFCGLKRVCLSIQQKKKARAKVNRAITSGKLLKQPCEVCGNKKADAHHDDYNKPLEVRWMCRSCHKKWHSNNEPIRVKRTGVQKGARDEKDND